jgi:ankyrin repeat protein
LLSLLAGEERIKKCNTVDENGRTPAMFAAYYNNLDNIELLSASEARFQLTDIRGRSCMHYAAINDSDKVITTIFI